MKENTNTNPTTVIINLKGSTINLCVILVQISRTSKAERKSAVI